MSPVITESDVAVLLSQKTPSGSIIYLYPVVRDMDVMLSDENGPENLAELIAQGIKPSFSSIQAIFQNSSDFTFEFDEDAGTVKGTHKNLISAGSAKGTEGDVEHGGEIRIPSFKFDNHGHITETGVSVITLPQGYTLPKASETELGGIMVGAGLSVDADGKVSVNLNSSIDSDSTTEAATPKAVKDALAAVMSDLDARDSIIVSETQPANPSVGYTMWFNVLSTE